MNWGMVMAIIGANIGLVAILVAFVLWAFSKLDGDIKSLSTDIKDDMRVHSARTDQLYQMFVDLLKSQAPKTNP